MNDTTPSSGSDNPADPEAAGLGVSEPSGLREDRTVFQASVPLSPDQDTKAAKWAADNARAIAANLQRIEKFGTFGEDLRSW